MFFLFRNMYKPNAVQFRRVMSHPPNHGHKSLVGSPWAFLVALFVLEEFQSSDGTAYNQMM
jgi:hypothetical protein